MWLATLLRFGAVWRVGIVTANRHERFLGCFTTPAGDAFAFLESFQNLVCRCWSWEAVGVWWFIFAENADAPLDLVADSRIVPIWHSDHTILATLCWIISWFSGADVPAVPVEASLGPLWVAPLGVKRVE